MNISTRFLEKRMRMTKQTRAHVEWVARAHWQFPDTKAAPPSPPISYSSALLNNTTLLDYHYYLYYPQLEWSSTERECDHLEGGLGGLVDIYRTHSEKLPTEGSLATLDKLTIDLEGDAEMSIHRQNQFHIEVITILNNNLVHILGWKNTSTNKDLTDLSSSLKITVTRM